MSLLQNVFSRFVWSLKNIICHSLKEAAVDLQLMLNQLKNLMHAMPWECMLVLTLCVLQQRTLTEGEGSVQLTSSLR
jgi:hypothetical protein